MSQRRFSQNGQQALVRAYQAAREMGHAVIEPEHLLLGVLGEESALLNREYLDTLRNKCYNQPSPLWTLPQLMWLKKHEPESLQKGLLDLADQNLGGTGNLEPDGTERLVHRHAGQRLGYGCRRDCQWNEYSDEFRSCSRSDNRRT